MPNIRKGLLLTIVVLLILLVAAGAAFGKTPKRVMIVVMDQMQPGYAQQYDMKNVLWLENRGVNFKRAYVGDMASETVVSHNVMVSGLFPKHMGWSDEAIRDVDNVLGYGANHIVTVGDLGTTDYVKLIAHYGPYPKLGDYLKAKFPGTIIANVGEKGYQVETMAANSPTNSSDYWVRMGSKKKTADLSAPFSPASVPWTGTYRGAGGNPPSYIKNDPRFLVSVGNNSSPNDYYNTKVDEPAWMYPEDGRYVEGVYPGHESGDIWVADAALKIMDNENWSGLWVTFSAIDKVGHMWGGGAVDTLANYEWDPNSIFRQVHMPWAAKNADDQLGRLIDKLKEKGQFDDTLIVVTADHGSTYGGKGWYGDNVYDGGNTNGWYAGGPWWPSYTNTTDPTKDPNYAAGPSALKPLMDTGLVEFSYQSTSIESWLKDPTAVNKAAAADVMATLPGVIATFVKAADNDSYTLTSKGAMTPAERRWFNRHGQELVDTMAFEGSGDVVGLLADKTVYAVYGDHGGAQKDVQRIPMAFWAAGIQHTDRGTPMRLADITPTILRTLGIKATSQMDGVAQNLPMPGK
jgi:hypothetical protein